MYSAGLLNRYYSYIAAFILASMMLAEIVLPPSLMGDTVGRHFRIFKDVNQVTWNSASTDSLLDAKGIQRAWQAQGTEVHEVRSTNVVQSK